MSWLAIGATQGYRYNADISNQHSCNNDSHRSLILQIFDEQGSFLGHVDTHAAPLFGPQSISATSENQVIVADSGNHCVKVFHYDAP